MSVIGCKWTMPDHTGHIEEIVYCSECKYVYNSEVCKTVRDQIGMSLIHGGE